MPILPNVLVAFSLSIYRRFCTVCFLFSLTLSDRMCNSHRNSDEFLLGVSTPESLSYNVRFLLILTNGRNARFLRLCTAFGYCCCCSRAFCVYVSAFCDSHSSLPIDCPAFSLFYTNVKWWIYIGNRIQYIGELMILAIMCVSLYCLRLIDSQPKPISFNGIFCSACRKQCSTGSHLGRYQREKEEETQIPNM